MLSGVSEGKTASLEGESSEKKAKKGSPETGHNKNTSPTSEGSKKKRKQYDEEKINKLAQKEKLKSAHVTSKEKEKTKISLYTNETLDEFDPLPSAQELDIYALSKLSTDQLIHKVKPLIPQFNHLRPAQKASKKITQTASDTKVLSPMSKEIARARRHGYFIKESDIPAIREQNTPEELRAKTDELDRCAPAWGIKVNLSPKK